MSGKGGSPPPGGDGAGCAAFYKNIPLLSPNPAVVKDLKKGDKLEFGIVAFEGRTVLRVEHNGSVAGSVTKNAAQLIKCIQDGHTYIAIVTEVEGGSVTLEARMQA